MSEQQRWRNKKEKRDFLSALFNTAVPLFSINANSFIHDVIKTEFSIVQEPSMSVTKAIEIW